MNNEYHYSNTVYKIITRYNMYDFVPLKIFISERRIILRQYIVAMLITLF